MNKNLLASIPKLSKETYQRWKFDVTALLEAEEVWDIVSGVEVEPMTRDATHKTWKKKDSQAKGIISMSLDEEHHAAIRTCQSSSAMWVKLVSMREQSSETNKILARIEFY